MTIKQEMEWFRLEGMPGEIFGEYLMRTADRREAEFQARVAAANARDVARLRALVKEAEQHGSADRCPWCERYTDMPEERHTADCPAFTPDGTVR